MKKHQHKHECAHESVKFCADCAKVYCEKCGEEWTRAVPTYPMPFIPERPMWPVRDELPAIPWTITWNPRTLTGTLSDANTDTVNTDTVSYRITPAATCQH